MSKQSITLGIHLDGQRAFPPGDTLGETAVGPLGFLNILEGHLGLIRNASSQAERIVQYRDCLAQADAASRFYHASFQIDPLGTSATLLKWRDLWWLHGWSGSVPDGAGRRLVDIGAVEALASKSVAPSIGERLVRINAELDVRELPIESVRIVDPFEAFPQRWQSILRQLPVQSVADADACGAGFLGELQRALRDAAAGKRTGKIPWVDDGGVTVVQGETRLISAAWLSTCLDTSDLTLLVSGADGYGLDAPLTAAGHPRQGLKDTSAFRPALQVLPLVLELLWDPLNLYGLVQFLTHPICPLPGYAMRRLAAKVADAPGIGGARWAGVLEDIDNHYGAEAPEVREKIAHWIEHPRFSPEVGAPLGDVIERVQRLADFFRGGLGDADAAKRAAFNAGYAQCQACAESLQGLMSQGEASIRPRQLQKLVDQATANGAEHPLLFAEVGAALAVTHPGAAVAPVDQVVWWQLAMPVLPSSYPWSTSELRALAGAGVALPSSEDCIAQAGREWLRPIMAAREHLVLVLPSVNEEVHPIWQMIEAVTEKPTVLPLERLLTRPTRATRPAVITPLPSRRRWWHLPEGTDVPLARKESFSSLELLLFNPYHWLLKYPAALRPSRIAALGGDFRMLGNLAHGLVEAYYRQPEALQMTDAEFSSWFGPKFDRLLREEGAVLCMPGRGAELQGFRHRLLQAVMALRRHMADAGVVRVDPELALDGHFTGGELAGFADLTVQKRTGERAIIDMKWSGGKKFPQKFKRNNHLQLAIYAELLRQQTDAWPAVAYYVLDRARLIAPDDRMFPDAECVESSSGENTPMLWHRFVETWKWRKAQIDAGAFEVALEAIAPTEESSPPDTAMALEYLNEAYNDYRALAGWGD